MTKFILALIIFSHIFILSKLIFFPYPELFVYPYLTNQGLKPYAQILDQHFPGLMFLPINFDNLGMNDEKDARLWLFGVVTVTQTLLFLVSKKIIGGRKALFVNFLYLIWQPFFEGWVLWIDSFLPLVLLPAFYFLYREKIFFAGLFLGLGIVFKQTILPLAFLVLIYIWWENRKLNKPIIFMLGLLPPVIFMITYLASIGVLKDFWYWTIIFNLTIFAKYGTSIPTSIGFVTRAAFVYLTSLLLLFDKDKKLVKVLFIFLIGSFIGVFDRANFVHFQPSLPFAVIGTALGLYSLKRARTYLILIGGLYLVVTIWWQNIFYKGHISDKIFFFDESTYATLEKILEYTNTNDKIFVFGAAPHLYQMSKTLPSGDVFVFQFPWFLKVAEDRILEGIKRDNPEIVVSDRTVKIEGIPITDFASKIDKYLRENYQEIDSLGSVKILKKKVNDG